MAMIQGIDGSALLQAFRAGRNDRYANEDRLRAQQKEDAEAERGEQVRGLVGQLFGGSQPGGVAAQYGAQPTAQPQTFGEAFTPDGIAAAGPPSPAMTTEAPRRQPNPDVLAQLIILDPETGGQIVSALKNMDEMDLKRIEARNNFMGAAARYVAQGRTPQERMQRFQIAAPQLLDVGYTPEELDGIDNDLSDERLQFYMATAIDYDKMIDNELAEREFQQGKILTPQPGEGAFRLRPDGTVETLVQPNPGGMPAGAPVGDIPQVSDEASYNAIPPGQQYYDPEGNLRTKGGGGGDVTGGFPGGTG